MKIQNIALIPQVEIGFDNNFNVLTGETGAGKSIIVGSFNFILGEKLSKNAIRSGAASARVDAVFAASESVLKDISELTGIEIEDSVILSRTLKTDGKSECRINGTVVTAAVLKETAGLLIHIHGQHETEVLLKPKNHLSILDNFGGMEVQKVKAEYNAAYQKLVSLRAELKTFGGSDAERDRMIDIYQYQIKEIEQARLKENEDDELAELKQKMISFEKISNNLNAAKQAFRGVGFGQVISMLSGVANLDTKIEKMLETARSVKYDIDDIENSIQNYLDGFEFDEETFKNTDARLDEIKILKRKYGSTIPSIFEFLEAARKNLDFLTSAGENAERIKKQIGEQEKTVQNAAKCLSDVRKNAAQVFEKELMTHLKDLGMPACLIQVKFTETEPSQNGADEAEFLFSANAGETVKPLASIISGGEMARFMLGLKTITAKLSNISTLVFDEIDTGVGGTMGAKIAEKMQILSKTTQVICVTHLTQIAAMADVHFLIQKDEINGKTVTNIKRLENGEKTGELARMVGAAAADKTAREHALAMQEWASGYKKSISP